MPDPTFHIRFPKKARPILCKTDLDPIWARVWLNLSGLKAGRCQEPFSPVSGCVQPACLHSSKDIPDNIQNQPRSDLVQADCARFWPDGSGPEASQCSRIIRPVSGQCFQAIQPGCKLDPACLLGLYRNDCNYLITMIIITRTRWGKQLAHSTISVFILPEDRLQLLFIVSCPHTA